MSLKVYALAVCLFVLSLVVACAEEPAAPASPSEIVRLSTEAFKAQDLEEYASYYAPDELERLQGMMWPLIEALNDKTNTGADVAQLFGVTFQDGKPVKESPERFFVGFLRGITQVVPEVMDAVFSMEYELIGEFQENDSTVHVLTRMSASFGEMVLTQIEVVSTKRVEDEWKLMLTGEMQGLAQQLQMGFSR